MKWLFVLILGLVWADPAQDNIRFLLGQKFEEKGDLDRALLDYQNFLVEEPQSLMGFNALGRVYLRKKSYGQAALNFQETLKLNPNNASALKGLGETREAQGSREKAIAQYRKLADSSPDQKKWAEARIEKIMASQRTSSSGKFTDSPPSGGSYDYDSNLFKKGKKLTQAGDDEGALKVWRQILKKEPGNPGAYYFAGVNRYNKNDFKNAAINFKKGYKYPDMGHNAHYYLGRIAEKGSRNRDAVKHYENYLAKTQHKDGIKEVKSRIKSLTGNSPPLQDQDSSTGEIKKVDGEQAANPSLAIEGDLKKASKITTIHPLNTKGYFVIHEDSSHGADELKRAWIKYRKSKIDDAITLLKDITMNYPSSVNALAAHYNLASIHRELGLNKNVLSYSRMILRNQPPEPYRSSLYYLMAQSEFESGSKKKALEYLNQVKTEGSLGPTSAKKLSFEADLASKLDQGEDGIQKMKLAIDNAKTEEKKRVLMYDLARMYLNKKSISEGVQIYRDLLSKCPKSGNLELCRRASVGIADENFKLKNWDVAEKYYKKTLEEFEDVKDNPWSQYQLGNIYAKQRKFSAAVKAYNLVQENFSESYWASQAQWKRDDTIWRKEYEGVLTQ